MKLFIKHLASIIIFIYTGELIFNFHETYASKNINYTDSQFVEKVIDSSNSKIILLGDSYIKGLGIKEQDKMRTNIKYKNYKLYDFSQGGNNWFNYLIQIDTLSKNLDGNDILIIGVNWNDINFKLGAINSWYKQRNVDSPKKEIEPNKLGITNPREVVEIRGLKKYLRNIYKSHLVKVLSPQIQNFLKRHNLALPIGDFHYFRTKAYSEKAGEMDLIRDRITKIQKSKNITVIIYLMPDFNLLKNKKYFKKYIEYFNGWQSNGIVVINGFDDFNYSENNIYCLSIHDGHPNSLASKKISDHINKKMYGVMKNKFED